MHSTLLEKIGKEQIKRTTGCEVKFWGALTDSGKKIGASATAMVSDATEKAADKKRYAPRKAKLYDSEKIIPVQSPGFLDAGSALCDSSTLLSSLNALFLHVYAS